MNEKSLSRVAHGTIASDTSAIVALVHQRTGLTFPPNRMFIVEAGVRRAMRSAGIRETTVYTQQLATDAALMDDLFAELTVGETYFFRDPGQLDVIREHIFPLFREDAAASGSTSGASSSGSPGVRVWSAGCATGEEPHTLAMMLADADMAHHAYVIGTDISRERLHVAQRGQYRTWSMRGVDDAVIDRHFTRHQEKFNLSPKIRQMVEFRYLNLGLDQYPSPALGVWAMDLILCRNVLIYFDEATVKMVAKRMLDSLSLRGWLFLGASDPMISELVPCEVVTTPAGLAYRRRRAGGTQMLGMPSRSVVPHGMDVRVTGARDQTGDIPPVQTLDMDWNLDPDSDGNPEVDLATALSPDQTQTQESHAHSAHYAPPADAGLTAEEEQDTFSSGAPSPSSLSSLYAVRDYTGIATQAPQILQTHPMDESTWILLVRSLANLGRLADAERSCMAAIERCVGSAELWYLHAILLAESSHHIESAQAARRALYLDRDFVVAHLALGTALRKVGDLVQARRAFTNALHIAERLPPDSVVPAADGETSERIAMAARVQLQLAAEVA